MSGRLKFWELSTAGQALRQVAETARVACAAPIDVSSDGRSFATPSSHQPASGVVSLQGKLVDDAVIIVSLELMRAAAGVRVSAEALFAHLAKLSDRCRVAAPKARGARGDSSLWVELRVDATTPLSMARANALCGELKGLDALARSLQAELPSARTEAEIEETWKGLSEVVEPIHPRGPDFDEPAATLLDWAHRTLDLLFGAASVAALAPSPVAADFAGAALARAGMEHGTSFARLLVPGVNARALTELAAKAPGRLIVPAGALSLATSAYELGQEVEGLLASLAASGRAAVFSGTRAELQAALQGGQGRGGDPLRPAIQHVPETGLELLARFAVRAAGRAVGGVTRSAEPGLVEEIVEALRPHGPADQKRLLPLVARRTVHRWSSAGPGRSVLAASYASALSSLSESFAGLSPRPRAQRSPAVQERFVRALTDPGLAVHLCERLLSQEEALLSLVSRLRAECLTRPPHQPLRYCAQGTPGTGKSESAALLARWLDVPYVNIDAASMSDSYTATAQLLGSGRGIVGSFQAGRLEQVARHHTGVVVEVSDIDHAPPPVRSTLADLFLQVLETGASDEGSVPRTAQCYRVDRSLPASAQLEPGEHLGARRQEREPLAWNTHRHIPGTHKPVLSRRDEEPAVRREGQIPDPAAVKSCPAPLGAGERVPDHTPTVVVTRCDQIARWRDRDRGRCARRAHASELAHGPDIPGLP